jgi:predicted RNase H-like nuclease (RuvC/YqgF family)
VDEKQSRLDNMTKEYKEKKEECDKLTERIESIGEKFKLEHGHDRCPVRNVRQETIGPIESATRFGCHIEVYQRKFDLPRRIPIHISQIEAGEN